MEIKKIKKSGSYKNKKVAKVDDIDVDKILVSKKDSYDAKNAFKYLLDKMIMMLLDHYA